MLLRSITYIIQTTMKVADYCHLYQAALSKTDCNKLIELFEGCDEDKLEKLKDPFFTQMYLNQVHPELVKPLVRVTLGAYKLYKEDNSHTEYLPEKLAMEEFRVKRYVGGTGERFDKHVDVTSLVTMKRYLAFLFYLNEDFEGGETVFYDQFITKPKTGQVLVFPPNWQYPHAGLPVLTGTKYIMSTYLHFAC